MRLNTYNSFPKLQNISTFPIEQNARKANLIRILIVCINIYVKIFSYMRVNELMKVNEIYVIRSYTRIECKYVNLVNFH